MNLWSATDGTRFPFYSVSPSLWPRRSHKPSRPLLDSCPKRVRLPLSASRWACRWKVPSAGSARRSRSTQASQRAAASWLCTSTWAARRSVCRKAMPNCRRRPGSMSYSFRRRASSRARSRRLGGGRFEIVGRLTIKGQAQDLVVPVMITQGHGAVGRERKLYHPASCVQGRRRRMDRHLDGQQ